MVKRAPRFLRAVLSSTGEKDVLDKWDDVAQGRESISVYELQPPGAGSVHINRGHRGSGFYATGTYRWLDHIEGEALRDNAVWSEWAERQGPVAS
jgi:hypothetical protein